MKYKRLVLSLLLSITAAFLALILVTELLRIFIWPSLLAGIPAGIITFAVVFYLTMRKI